MCVASGPGKDMFESTKIIAERQYEVSKALLENEDGNMIMLFCWNIKKDYLGEFGGSYNFCASLETMDFD